MPSTGTIHIFSGGPLDAAVAAGSTVSVDYDSLLANIVVSAASRRAAAERLRLRLSQLSIDGVRTNRDTLMALLGEPDFLAGEVTTAYLDEHPELAVAGAVTGDDLIGHLLAVVFDDEQRNRAGDRVTGFAPSGWRNLRTVGQRRTWLLDGEPHSVEYEMHDGGASVAIGDWPVPQPDGALMVDARRRPSVRLLARSEGRQVIELDGVRRAIDVVDRGDAVTTRSGAGSLTWIRAPRFVDHDDTMAGSGPVCPLPGTVIAVHVEPGQSVTEGTVLMVVEAMKMEHKITAHGDAVVGELRFGVGDRVDAGDLLVVLNAVDGDA